MSLEDKSQWLSWEPNGASLWEGEMHRAGSKERVPFWNPSHFRLKGCAMCFKIRKSIFFNITPLITGIYLPPSPRLLSQISCFQNWIFSGSVLIPGVSCRYQTQMLCARLGILVPCRTTISKRSALRSCRHPIHYISQSFKNWIILTYNIALASFVQHSDLIVLHIME